MDMLCRFPPAGQIEIAPARRARADEDGIVAFGEQLLHRIDTRIAAEVDTEIEYVADFLVDHFLGQTEARHLRAHKSAALFLGLEHGHVIAERHKIARDGQ